MGVNNSGSFGSVSGVYFGGNGLVDASFCFAGSDSSGGYAGSNILNFGFNAGFITIVNEGSNDLCYQWPALKSVGFDSGVVKAGQTQVFGPLANKSGVSLRARNSGSATSFIVSAI